MKSKFFILFILLSILIIPKEGSSLTAPQNIKSSAGTVFPLSYPNWSEINKKTRESLVNILCTNDIDGFLEPLTGSGVIIDKRGIILTNAHIAEYFLIKDFPRRNFINCFIRTGSPASASYKANILYIPSIWVEKNFSYLKMENPTGTGENDFAFLEIGDSLYGTISPKEFSPLKIALSDKEAVGNGQVLIASYPAGFLGGILTERNLYISSSISKVINLFTFTKDLVDLLNIAGNPVAQKGASGGAIVNSSGQLAAIISTMTEGKTTDKREIQATTLSHIDRELKKQTGLDLQNFLNRDMGTLRQSMSSTTEEKLRNLLIKGLKGN